jgi:hypothetical protein
MVFGLIFFIPLFGMAVGALMGALSGAFADSLCMIGEGGMPLHAVQRTLEREGVPTPNGQPWWNTRTIKDVVLDDCYRPPSAPPRP